MYDEIEYTMEEIQSMCRDLGINWLIILKNKSLKKSGKNYGFQIKFTIVIYI
jgi:hypothetical protein